MKKDAKAIFKAGVEAVNPEKAIIDQLSINRNLLEIHGKSFDLEQYEEILVIGAGKASAAMARAVENILQSRITAGLVIVKYGHGNKLKHIHVIEAGHPIPDQNGLAGSKQIVSLLQEKKQKSLVLGLFSGGGSALMTLPVEGITLEEKMNTTNVLLRCGASIQELNTIRKHLSLLKGGRLMEKIYPSSLLSLILSDVVGDHLDVIASGPMVGDPTTFYDCLNIIEKYRIREDIPVSVLDLFQKGCDGTYPETPKPGDSIFQESHHFLIGNNRKALQAAFREAELRGYNTLLLSSLMEGDTREAARFHAALVKEVKQSGNPIKTPSCLLSGGETTVVVTGTGKGGRNQEFALAAAMEVSGLENICILSAGTDGNDGPTDAAGAFATGETVNRARKIGLNPERVLENNDSYTFFKKLDDLLITGPTKTNVMDLRVCLIK